MTILDLIISTHEKINFDDVFLSVENKNMLVQLSKEHRLAEELLKHKLPLTNKILFHGASGCGKTMSANALASVLNKKLLVVNLSNIVCSKIGETSQNIKTVFDKAIKEKAILFLDEFDHIAKARGNDENDVGEMRRLVNSVIQLIDLLPQDVILIAATNHAEIIDNALMRRFQLKLEFLKPTQEQLNQYYDQLASLYDASISTFDRKYNLSYAEAKDYALIQIKNKLINQLENSILSKE
jgi:SpoVK/Ycf46/Vps4 family AAA+-type ATPase